MNRADFVATFGGMYEHSSWVAERAFDRLEARLSLDAVQSALRAEVDDANHAEQLALLRAHPDLAGRAALAGTLTAASTAEQAGSGLDTLTQAEYDQFAARNHAYTEKFGFPFIMAVKGATKHQILDGFAARLPNTVETEFATAIEQVHRIAGFRLVDWFKENTP